MKIFVSGGAGYLGSVLVEYLLSDDCPLYVEKVTVLDSFRYEQNSLNQHCINPCFEVVRGDARDFSIVKPLLAEADVVIPLAALVGVPQCKGEQSTAWTTNYQAVVQLCECLSKDQLVLFPNTNSGYGIGGEAACTEESPLRPLSLYGQSKADAEQRVMQHPKAICFRLATVFGMSPRMRIDLLVNDFVYRAMHDRAVTLFESHFRRNYIHVRDVARVFVHAILKNSEMAGNVYNVGLDQANLTKLELCQLIKAYLPAFTFSEAPIGEDPDKRDYLVSNTKIAKTDFRPMYGLDHGIKELIKGFTMLRNTRYGNA